MPLSSTSPDQLPLSSTSPDQSTEQIRSISHMASSGDGSSPAQRVVDGLLSIRGLIDEVISITQSAMHTSLGGDGGADRGSGMLRNSGPDRRSSSSNSKRRSRSSFFKTVTTTTLEDRNSWRKYGQRFIQGSSNPRGYYKCTHRPKQGCRATRQIQASEGNPSEYTISYFGEHTCRDRATAPMDSRSVEHSSSLSALHGSPRATDREQLAAAVPGSEGITSAATAGSAPAEFLPGGACDMTDGGAGTGSFPWSPSWSFEDVWDDSLFGFNP